MNRQNHYHEHLARYAMAYILAGGRGSRLMELTDRQAKPAVFFGGKSRIIDFALSNSVNSGMRHIAVATQYQAHSLIRHLQQSWNVLRPERNESFNVLPASQRVSQSRWYTGTADAVYQNIDIIANYGPEHVVILAGDHVYKMDFEIMLREHVKAGADVTVGCLEVPRPQASCFGVMAVDTDDRITSFIEKPKDPPGIPGRTDRALASMGIYVFSTAYLVDELRRDAADPASGHDFGADLIPHLVRHGRVVAHQFARSCVKSDEEAEPYWRDVGTVDAYWEANIDLTSARPALDLHDSHWPIWTQGETTPAAKFVSGDDSRPGMVVNSSVSGGCVISGASLRRSLLFAGVQVEADARLEGAVVLPYASIGRDARLHNVVIDHSVRIPDGLVVGEDERRDAQRFRRTGKGICLITQQMIDRMVGVN